MRSRLSTRPDRSAAALALFIAAGCAKAPPAAPVPPPIAPLRQLASDFDALIDRPGHQHGIWAVAVQSLARGDRLYERNPRTLLVPASTMKLVSVAVAADAVGWDHRFETRVLAGGRIHEGALKGDLVVEGSGDPTVLGRAGEAALDGWVDALRSRGITRIEGRVVADDNAVEEPAPGFAWSWDDLGYAYGALPGALNLAENRLAVTISPSSPGMPAIVELPADARGLAIVNDTITGAPDDTPALWPERRAGEAALRIRGTIPAGSRPAVLSVAAGNPTLWFARALRHRLLAAGIDVEGKAVDADDLPYPLELRDAAVLHVHRSAPLAGIARPLIKDSINLYAEAVLLLATGPGGWRSTWAALDAARARLESWGIPKEGIQMVDGSGLSRRDVIAPDTLVTLLARFHDPSGASPWMQAMAVAGRDGSLADRMKGTPAEGNAIGKTGSMSNIRTFAGYVRTADGEPLAFAIMANNFEGPASGVTATIDRLVARLASFSRTPRATH
jgi:D-alanyl-D-alanine carboxypeptidase/D-alanyl-D-alanine-endopeptidase (penicillin-binding protein 4)